jgi:NAD(P)-dependent dehydrogenase (short-subunit alcohol dehydrogenase family)
MPRNILIMGASYGSLLAIKLLGAGHRVHLACLPNEAALLNDEGARVRMPVKGREGLLEIDSRGLPGKLSAGTPAEVDPAAYDLVALAMQEPQYRAAGVRDLLQRVVRAGVPCMSIMNMPPLPYLARIPGVAVDPCRDCYTDPTVWDGFDPALMTLCSPDPQAFRPPGEKLNVLQVRLATNFKAARFEAQRHTDLLRELASDIERARFRDGDARIETPVKLKVHESVFVPLAKWSMLLAGNYRCVQETSVRSIRETVHGDLAAARAVYEWVAQVCRRLGAADGDLVPFDKYANAALSLESPSSAARALAGGATHIERVDRLVQTIAAQHGMRSDAVDRIVALVDAWLARNKTRTHEDDHAPPAATRLSVA